MGQLKLKSDVGRVEVKGLGIVLTPESSEADIKRAIKRQPNIMQLVEGGKVEK